MVRKHEVRFLSFGIGLLCVISLPFLLFCALKFFGFSDSTIADTPDGLAYSVAAEDEASPVPGCTIAIRSPSFFMRFAAEKCIDVECGGECTIFEREAEEKPAPQEPDVVDPVPDIRWYEGHNVYDFVHWAAILSFTLSLSVVGVMSSVLTRTDGSRRNVRIDGFTDIVMVMFFSTVAGFLLLMLCIGGFLGGSLFPRFDGGIKNFGFNSWSGLDFRGPEWGKLAVWAYISGFYERFIPGIFDQLLDQGRKSQIGEGRNSPEKDESGSLP